MTHLNLDIMAKRRARLHRTQSLWNASQSCKQLLATVSSGALRLNTPIMRIVSLGLGRLNADPAFYQSALQHMSVFSIASRLNAFNEVKYPGAPRVSIMAQDACYEQRGRILLQELTSVPIDFGLSDLKTLLSIDAHTLAVSAFLPTSVLLTQIVADMCDGEKGPGMISWDRVEVRVEKRGYCVRNRDAPGVARTMKGYRKWEMGLGEMDGELCRDVKATGKYSLDFMD